MPDQFLNLVTSFFYLKKNCKLFKIKSVHNKATSSINRKIVTNFDRALGLATH